MELIGGPAAGLRLELIGEIVIFGRALGGSGAALGGSGGAPGGPGRALGGSIYIQKLPINRPSGRYVFVLTGWGRARAS